MKSFILAALVGAMTLEEINAVRVVQQGPSSGIAEHAAGVSAAAGNLDKDNVAGQKALIRSQAGAEASESVRMGQESADLEKAITAKINAESELKAKKRQQRENTKEEREAALHKKITEEIKARKEINDELIKAGQAAAVAAQAENEARHRQLRQARKNAIASIDSETAKESADRRAAGLKASAAATAAGYTDEDYIANLPAHYLAGYVGVEEDIEGEDAEDEGSDGDNDEDDGLVGMDEEDLEAEDEENGEEDGEEDENDQAADAEENEQENDFGASPAQSFAQKPSAHLHKTNIRVDPPLLADGKKSIAEAEKALTEAKEEYDKLKDKAQDLEFKFKSAARRSRHAREGRGEAEDAYYIAAKNARKSARHAENLAREAQQAAAKQAASDKYSEVISAANSDASAKAPKPDGPAAKTGPAKADDKQAAAEKPAAAAKAPAK